MGLAQAAAGHAAFPPAVGEFTASRLFVIAVPVVDAPPTESWGLWYTDHGGYSTVLRFLPAAWGGPEPGTILLGAHQTGAFMRLPMLIPGDRVTVALDNVAQTYIVETARVVEWLDGALFTHDGLVLVTCTTASPTAVWAVFLRVIKDV